MQPFQPLKPSEEKSIHPHLAKAIDAWRLSIVNQGEVNRVNPHDGEGDDITGLYAEVDGSRFVNQSPILQKTTFVTGSGNKKLEIPLADKMAATQGLVDRIGPHA